MVAVLDHKTASGRKRRGPSESELEKATRRHSLFFKIEPEALITLGAEAMVTAVMTLFASQADYASFV